MLAWWDWELVITRRWIAVNSQNGKAYFYKEKLAFSHSCHWKLQIWHWLHCFKRPHMLIPSYHYITVIISPLFPTLPENSIHVCYKKTSMRLDPWWKSPGSVNLRSELWNCESHSNLSKRKNLFITQYL